MGYLTQEALQGLKAYVYKPAGYTWLDDLHQPFWNWLVTQLPLWLAPNLITLMGLLGVVLSSWLMAIFQPSFEGEVPSWVLTLAGLSACVYANLDCIDGKQARRTGTSSPLGQLFDHGCDAYIVHLLVGFAIACLGTSCGWRASVGSLWVMLPWILAQLEEYHTGNMLYGNGIWGVLEALYSTAFVCFATAAVGSSHWTVPIAILPAGWRLSIADLVVIGLTLTGSTQVIGQVWRILCTTDKTLSPTEKGNKTLDRLSIFWHFCVVFAMVTAGSIWMAMADESTCRLAHTSYGTAYALVATQLIVAHMAKIEFSPTWWTVPSLFLCAINATTPFIDPLWAAILSLGLYNLIYMHYVYHVVAQICQYLDIWCFAIKRKS